MDICFHCDEPAPLPVFDQVDQEHERPFCCQGCLTVFSVLKGKGLEAYYDIKSDAAIFRKRSPVTLSSGQYLYLEQDEFQSEYSYKSHDGHRVMEFYLEGIHCLACLWLIEKLPEFVPNVLSSKLDIDKSVVTVVITDEGKFSSVAKELDVLGYRPHALKKNQSSQEFLKKEERRTLMRIGVAGAAAGNIMIYAVSLYGGATSWTAEYFNLLTVALAMPVLTWCAWPFYQSAWYSLKNKSLSIDVPISLALILGAIMGVVNVIKGIHENYFDSLTTLIFLLLLSRYFLRKIQEKGLQAQDLHFFYQNDSVQRQISEDKFEEVHPRFINEGDILKVRVGELISADGPVIKGETRVNNSLLTGESRPVKVTIGDYVFSGAQNIAHEFLMKAEKIQKDSRLGGILKNVENGWANRSRTVDITAKISVYFTAVVILLSLVLFAINFSSLGAEEAMVRAVTLLIVTCPCALALAVPLTFNRALGLAGSHGIVIKSDETLERLEKSQSIFFDKTGTLTFGRLRVENFQILTDEDARLPEIILALESKSKHPTAKALVEFAQSFSPKVVTVENYLETTGMGVSGSIEGVEYEIRKNSVLRNNKVIATFEVKDSVRPESKNIVEKLRDQGLKVTLLSGDNEKAVKAIAEEAGISSTESMANVSPEEKHELLRRTYGSIMVGDGANDAMALEAAQVGIAVSGSMDIALRAADVYLTTPGVKGVEKVITLSHETMKVIHRNLAVSILYNLISVVLVFSGHINPLIAAIVMPISSLTVLLSAMVGTKKMRSLWRS